MTLEALEGRTLLAGVVATYPLPRPLVVVGGITAGPDNNLWFGASYGGIDGGQIGRITTDGTTTLFPVPGNPTAIGGITAGPDGALWFTDVSGSIGRITTDGAATEFPVPTAFSFPTAIAAGPDGALWFTEAGTDKIGRITTGGVITEFATPTADSQPAGIAAGPDGALWFVEQRGNKIGRITTGGDITEFAIPTANSQPYGITAGPDGNLWFAEIVASKIGRITTDGVITEFAAPSLTPTGITAGPDGNLWFTESNRGGIGRITPGGVVTDFPVPAMFSQTFGITAGPDGNLWFTSNPAMSTLIGKVNPGPTSQTQLTAEPGLSAAGQAVTLTATVNGDGSGVAPTGSVAFAIDGGPATTVPLALTGGRGQATLSVSTLAIGSHSIVATYGGAPGLSPSAAVTTVAVVPAPAVASVRRLGFHAQPTSIVLGFTSSLDPARAQDLSNYRIVGPGGQVIAIASAVYSPTSATVTLTPRRRLDLHFLYRLTVKGTGAGGLTDTSGIPLAGAADGRAGSDFVTELGAADLVLGAQVPGGPARLARLRRVLSGIEKDQAKQLAQRHHASATHPALRAVPPRPPKVVARHH